MSTIIAHHLEKVLHQVQQRLRRIGAALYAESDARALHHGWTIKQRWGGLARTYRDPRFDQFRRCHRCDGTGVNRHASRRSCFLCWGTGRLTTDPAPEPIRQRAS